MSAEVAILLPVLGRPNRVRPVARGFASSKMRPLFIADPDDTEEIEALDREGAEYIAPGGNYARKIRAGIAATTEPLIFTGADDLEPRPGWLKAAKAAMRGGIEVVGINDMIPRRRERHATHFLMTRVYAERPAIDGSPGPFFAGYSHSFTDDELIATARHRGVYAYAPAARMLHLHPMANRAKDDETYRKGRERMRFDRRLFRVRSRLWR